MIVLIYQILLLDFPKYILMKKKLIWSKSLFISVKSSLVEFGPGVLKDKKMETWKISNRDAYNTDNRHQINFVQKSSLDWASVSLKDQNVKDTLFLSNVLFFSGKKHLWQLYYITLIYKNTLTYQYWFFFTWCFKIQYSTLYPSFTIM